MERRRRLHLLIGMLLWAGGARGRVLLTQQQALAAAFPAGVTIRRETHFLTRQQMETARRGSGADVDQQLVIRYVGLAGEKPIGYVYFDTHRVRTLPETIMVVVSADGRIDRIEILAFDEPIDYFPRPRWIDQLRGRRLDSELSLNRAIRPLSGASLTGQAVVSASRRILALHKVIG